MHPIKLLLLPVMLLPAFSAIAQQRLIQAGPMQGYTEFRTAKIWVEAAPAAEKLLISYRPAGTGKDMQQAIQYNGKLGREFNPVTFQLTGLAPGTKYEYTIKAYAGETTEKVKGTFTTQDLWPYRKPVPDVHFLAGSCSYFNDPRYDRPGTPYGSDSSIYVSMANAEADFMLWLGDNWYTRDVDYYSRWGLWNRAHYVRTQPVLQHFLKSKAHYAIWDDHDFGPNNFGTSYVFKDESRKVFKNYWANPSYGMDGKGIYTQFAYGDVAFFLLDDRTWRNSDDMKDSINGRANPGKHMLGREQMSWLKDALLQSRYATFKVIVNGSQVLNTYTPYDCFYHYPAEFTELIDFISDNKIDGVIFMSGDRHHSEIIKMERPGHYTLYDVTVSSLTSRLYGPGKEEENMPTRVKQVPLKHNYAKVSITGASGERTLTVRYYDKDSNQLEEWSVKGTELKDQ